MASIEELTFLSEDEKNEYKEDCKQQIRSYAEFKWDCAVLTELVNEHNYAAIIALFQEGESGAHVHFGKKHEDKYCPSYQGIRYRDAIMVCVVDLEWIGDIERELKDLVNNYSSKAFAKKVADIRKDPM